MSFPSREEHRELLILDAGPIRELVLFHAVDRFRFESLRRELRFFPDRHAYQKCGQFVASFTKKTTSASVVAELNYWIRGTDRPGHKRLWQRVYDEFKNMGMDEEVVKLLDMNIDLVARYGPVDVSLLEIARRNYHRKPFILTVERELTEECRRAGIGASLLQEVVLGNSNS